MLVQLIVWELREGIAAGAEGGPEMVVDLHEQSLANASVWQQHGRQTHGKSRAKAWQRHGKNMAKHSKNMAKPWQRVREKPNPCQQRRELHSECTSMAKTWQERGESTATAGPKIWRIESDHGRHGETEPNHGRWQSAARR
jgi:hypothetical protein